MKASILDLRKQMSKIIAALDMNKTVTLTYRGKVKAKIVPVNKKPDNDLSECEAFGMWSDYNQTDDVNSYVRNIRKGRNHAI